MTRLQFRNVDADPRDPVETWPYEALRIALERGDLHDYRRIVDAIRRDPWGPVARRVQRVLEWTQPYGVATFMPRAIATARARAEQREREWVRETLREAVRTSGLTQQEFAARLGTSASRLSTYLSGSVVPAATLLARARDVAREAASPQRAFTTRAGPRAPS